MDLTNVFGVNVLAQFVKWFHGPFAVEFTEQFPGKGLTLVILDPDMTCDAMLSWQDPMRYRMFVAHQGSVTVAEALNGTLENVIGKLHFCLRTGYASVKAETMKYLVREGDFPHEGAGEYRDHFGGASGLAKEDDWKIYCQCVDKLIELLDDAIGRAMERAEVLRHDAAAPAGVKYLHHINLAEIATEA
ncbi:MAG TPA: hypothetical protein VLE72_00090 [Candidatus Saccharimonadales bacterium]|nr:hypothetical protein [Candidatus Saccharimonadales bacterium]